MDGQTDKATASSLIDELRTIRAQLGEAVGMASHLQEKFSGPRPSSEPPQAKEIGESVVTLVRDIRTRSSRLQRILTEHHDFLGTFNREGGMAATRTDIPEQARY